MIYKIEFTQYITPNGRKVLTSIEVKENVYYKAQEIIANDFRFESEMLSTGQASLTISDDWDDYSFQIVDNNENIIKAVDDLILEFNTKDNVEIRNEIINNYNKQPHKDY